MLDPDRLAELFAEAVELEGQTRQDFVDEQVKGDEALRGELLSLLAAHDNSRDFLEQPATAEAAALVPSLLGANLVGSQIDRWSIDALLHTGGMGSVFAATRVEEDFSQSGALKLVRVGLETPELLERFALERKLLAQMDHPNIARLLDGGTTAEGMPWLVMEYVDGLHIDAYADHHRLSLSERLRLFDQLCDAIAYLHQNLVTHQDIKASNVLVDQRGHVRVLDFGIATLLNERQGQNLEEGERRLSLASAAPEQLNEQPISTATDVYALGNLLYELLSGVPCHDLPAGLDLETLRELICVTPPKRMSEALSGAAEAPAKAARRRMQAHALIARLRGDLDLIVAKTLEKDPADRYRSVDELRNDLRAYHANRPITVRASSPAYRTGKFLRRHWRGLLATAATMVALGIGLGVALWQAEEAGVQRDRAQAMNAFMQEVLTEADPYRAGVDKRVRDVLEEASALLEERFADQPLLEASLRQAVGGVQLSLLEITAAENNLQRALALFDATVPDDYELRLRCEAHLAWLAFEREDFEASVEAYRQVMARLHTGHDRELRATIHNDLGLVLGEWERYEEGISYLEEAMRISPDSPDRTATLINLGFAYDGLGQLEEAKVHYLQAIERLRALGERGLVADLAHALGNYGNVLSQQDREEEALVYYLESLDVRARVFGPDSDSVGSQELNVGRLLLDMQRPAEARPHLARAVELLQNFRDEDSIYLRVSRASLARAVLLTSDKTSERAAAQATLERIHAAMLADDGLRESRFVEQIGGWAKEGSEAKPGSGG
ncbi:MAG: hypothetical protein Cons2KO_15240 [Congregibacter sp.]